MKSKLILILIVAATPSCNFIEALHQTSPAYKNPIIFSDNWKMKRAEEKIKRAEAKANKNP